MPQYQATTPPDPVTEELARAILEDFNKHLELRLRAMEMHFLTWLEARLQETREYMTRRTRERVKELVVTGDLLDLRRKKRQPIIPDWRVEGGQFPPDERTEQLSKQRN